MAKSVCVGCESTVGMEGVPAPTSKFHIASGIEQKNSRVGSWGSTNASSWPSLEWSPEVSLVERERKKRLVSLLFLPPKTPAA